MKTLPLYLSIVILLIPVGSRALNIPDMFPLDQIKPGMKGYGLSCFKGTTPIRLDVELLGLIGGPHPDKVKILARITGPDVDRGGIMSGMSGSPVYIDGKLAGAMAFAFPFAKEAICGITPIQQMSQLWSIPMDTSFTGTPAHRMRRLLADPSASAAEYMVPIRTPLVFSGPPQIDFSQLLPLLKNWNIVPVTSGASEPGKYSGHVLVPGGIVGVSLVSGDIQMAGMGTITWTDGEHVLGFGHSMFQSGRCRLPMTTGEVVSYLPSLMQSFKFINSGDVIGTIVADGTAGIAGTTLKRARMIPVTLDIHTDSGTRKTYRIKVFENRFLTDVFCAAALNLLLSSNAPSSGEYSLVMNLGIDVSGHSSVRRRRFFGTGENPLRAFLETLQPLSILLNNPIEPVTIENIALNCSIVEKHRSAELVSSTVSSQHLHPGDVFTVSLKYKRFRHALDIRRIRMAIPKSIRPGQYRIAVMDAATYLDWLNSRRTPEKLYSSVETLILDINRRIPENMLHVLLLKRYKSYIGESTALEKLPPTAEWLLGENGLAENIRDVFIAIEDKTVIFDHQINGNTHCNIKISPAYSG